MPLLALTLMLVLPLPVITALPVPMGSTCDGPLGLLVLPGTTDWVLLDAPRPGEDRVVAVDWYETPSKVFIDAPGQGLVLRVWGGDVCGQMRLLGTTDSTIAGLTSIDTGGESHLVLWLSREPSVATQTTVIVDGHEATGSAALGPAIIRVTDLEV